MFWCKIGCTQPQIFLVESVGYHFASHLVGASEICSFEVTLGYSTGNEPERHIPWDL